MLAHQPFPRCQHMRHDTAAGSKQGYDVEMLMAKTLPRDRKPHPVWGEVFRVVIQTDGIFGKRSDKKTDGHQASGAASSRSNPAIAAGASTSVPTAEEAGRSRLLAIADKARSSSEGSSSSSSSSSSSNKHKSKKDKKSKKSKKHKKSKKSKKDKKDEKDKKAGKRNLDDIKECMESQTREHPCTPPRSWRLRRQWSWSSLQRQKLLASATQSLC